MVQYAITDGTACSPGGAARLIESARRWADTGIDFVQLREKALAGGALLEIAEAMSAALSGSGTKLLINGRPDIAVAAEAQGVHLPARSGELSPKQVRRIFALAGTGSPVISVACHTLAEVAHAAAAGADLILLGPVFEKRVKGLVAVEGAGLEMLRHACVAAGRTPVLALGGVTVETSPQCLQAGASGVAGIRLFA